MFNKFLKKWNEWANSGSDRSRWAQRTGQAMFNALYDFDNTVAESIMGKELDPFYNDKRIPALLIHLSEIWKDQ